MAAGLEILSELWSRGLRVGRNGDRLAITPAALLDDRLRGQIRESKEAILLILDECSSDSGEGGLRLKSHAHGRDLWLARSEQIAAELVTEMAQPADFLPVVLFREIEPLFQKSPAMIRATLDAMAELPGTRLVR